MFKKILFPAEPTLSFSSLLLLIMRICLGLLFLNHGMQKWLYYGDLYNNFPDPLHIGSAWSLILIIISEVVCSFLFIFGLFYRLALLPMIFAMGMAFFVVHDGSLDGGELSLIYMMAFVFMYLFGPGRYSLDAWIGKRFAEASERKSV